MISINSISTKKFSLNGITYLKNYITSVKGEKIEIFNCYERKDVLIPLTHYSEFIVNGLDYSSAQALQIALLDVLYVRIFTSGDTTLLDQNNIGLKKVIGLQLLVSVGMANGNPTLYNVVDAINTFSQSSFTVTEKQTPVIVYAIKYQSINYIFTPVAKYTWLFLRGAGSWGYGGLSVTGPDFYELPTQSLTPDDIEETPGQSVTDLGDITGSDFLTVMNSIEHDLSDTEISYFFKYTIDGVQYVQLFIGTNGVFNNDFVESDFQMVTDSEQSAAIESIQQYDSPAQFPETGLDNVLYIVKTLVNNIPGGKMYRWTGTGYAIMNDVNAEPPISSGTTAQYWRGDKTWQTLNKAAVGLGNVNNTSDAAKPVSDATQAALNNKLNTGANASLAGGTVRVVLVTTDGTPIGEADISFNQITNNLTIGQDGISTGKLTVISNEFRLKVQNNIASGNAYVEFNADQEQALQFIDTNGVNYMTFKSLNGQQGIILLQRQVISRGVFYNLQWEQAAITTAGAGTKVYGKDSLGNDLSLTLDSNAQTIQASISFIVKNASGSEIIAGDFKPIVARIVNNNLSISAYTVNITSNHSNAAYHDWAVGVEHIAGTNTIKFYFTPDADDNTNYTGAFTEIKYNIG
ncbi:hypothetical protein [Flavobacterium rhizosphaerae]|uniref:Uncharacterized protein n=1 Tax=Flavobacterium rhizosphaerae TaxID=3163298 RepID=A0ABW8Z197_9FLAO